MYYVYLFPFSVYEPQRETTEEDPREKGEILLFSWSSYVEEEENE